LPQKPAVESHRSEEERRLAHVDYERHFKEWFAEQPPLVQEFLKQERCDKPEPFDYSRPRSAGDDDEGSDPAEWAVDPLDPRTPIVDFDSVNANQLSDYCDHFGRALVWATTSRNGEQPNLLMMGARMIAILTVTRPELLAGRGFQKMPLPKDMMSALRSALRGRDAKETGRFFRKPLAWICKTSSLLQLGKRSFAATYVLRGDLIEAATCAAIGGLDGKTRQAANKPVQEFSDSFSGISSLPMRGNKTRKRCKLAQLKNRRR
jgi:hypothetical protein